MPEELGPREGRRRKNHLYGIVFCSVATRSLSAIGETIEAVKGVTIFNGYEKRISVYAALVLPDMKRSFPT